MRLLLLFSAFLTALTGVTIGSAASAQPVEASASLAEARSGSQVHLAQRVAGFPHEVFATPAGWQVTAPSAASTRPASFGERRRL